MAAIDLTDLWIRPYLEAGYARGLAMDVRTESLQ